MNLTKKDIYYYYLYQILFIFNLNGIFPKSYCKNSTDKKSEANNHINVHLRLHISNIYINFHPLVLVSKLVKKNQEKFLWDQKKLADKT